MSDALSQACASARAWLDAEFGVIHARVRVWDLPQWKGTAMPTFFTCTVGSLHVGDVWQQAKDEVLITHPPELFTEQGVERVRVYGRIIRGWGSKDGKIRTWVWLPDQEVRARR